VFADTLSVEAPARIPTLGHSKSAGVPAAVVPLAVVAFDEANKAENVGAGVLRMDDEQPGRRAPSTAIVAAGKRRPAQT
jgi:hypothetical protein